MRDVRVLELAGSVSAAYCGRMLAATGADVVLAEPTGGAPTRALAPWLTDEGGQQRSATHEYLDAGKRSVRLADEDLDAAFRWADVVVSTSDGEPEAEEGADIVPAVGAARGANEGGRKLDGLALL